MEATLTPEEIKANVKTRLIDENVSYVVSQLTQAKGNEGIFFQVQVAGLLVLIKGLANATQDPHQTRMDLKNYVIQQLDAEFSSIIT